MPSDHTVETDLGALNRRIMARQLLSKNASGPGAVVGVSRACCGNNSQDFRESFSSFWARTSGFADEDLLKELRPKGGLARTWTVRGTVHTFPSRDYYHHVFGSGRRRILGRYDRYARRVGVPPLEKRLGFLYLPLMDDIRGKAVTTEYIKEFMIQRLNALGLKGRVKLARGWSNTPTLGPLWTGMTEMSYLGLLVSAGREGSKSLWMRSADWLAGGRKVPDVMECTVGLVRNYIEEYGPVTRRDIVYWNNCLLSDEVDACLESLRPELAEERLQGSKETYYSIGDGDYDLEPPEAIILPEFDSLIMGYGDKSRIMDQSRLGHVSRPQGIISRTVLIKGFIAGTWGKRTSKGQVTATVTPFKELRGKERRSVEEEFAEFGRYLDRPVKVEFRPPQGPV